MSIPRSFIDDLLARIDIVDVINARVKLKRRGANHMACCPFHEEKSPSFSVSQPKQFYYCFGCGAGGNAISFLMEYDRMGFVEAVESLASLAGVAVPQELEAAHNQRDKQTPLFQILGDVSSYYQKQLSQHQAAQAYVHKRGLSEVICQRYAVGYAPAGWDNILKLYGRNPEQTQHLLQAGLLINKEAGKMYDRFRERLMFPIRDARGRVLGFGGRVIGPGEPKYLNSPETPVFHKGRELYGLYEALQANRQLPYALIVEGYMDVVALAQHGIDCALATLGTATSTEHLQRIFRYTEKVIFCFDGDNAGRTAAWRALEVVLPLLQDGREVSFLFLPEGDDPDSYVRAEGQQALLNLLANATSCADFLLQHLSEQNNLNHMDGLARMAAQAAPLVGKIPGNFLRQLIFDKLANIVRMPSEKIQRLAAGETTTSPASTPTTRKRLGTSISPMRLAISLLLQQPALADKVDLQLFAEQTAIPGFPLFCQLVTSIREHQIVTTGTLLEHWRENEHIAHLHKLAAWEHDIPSSGYEAEFVGVLRKLTELLYETQIDQLMGKANIQGLQDSEKKQLQNLIAQKQALAQVD